MSVFFFDKQDDPLYVHYSPDHPTLADAWGPKTIGQWRMIRKHSIFTTQITVPGRRPRPAVSRLGSSGRGEDPLVADTPVPMIGFSGRCACEKKVVRQGAARATHRATWG